MFALEIINALNNPANPAKPKRLNARLKVSHRPTQGTKLCLGRGRLEDCEDCTGKLELDKETGATVWTPPLPPLPPEGTDGWYGLPEEEVSTQDELDERQARAEYQREKRKQAFYSGR